MNIYLIWQNENIGYNTYDSVVVVAEDKESAKLIHPNEISEKPWGSRSWCNHPDDVKVELVGKYKGTKTEPHVILSSFNAG